MCPTRREFFWAASAAALAGRMPWHTPSVPEGLLVGTPLDGALDGGADDPFAALKVFDAKGRPWRAAREDWPGARRRMRTREWRAWRESERRDIDTWIQKFPCDRITWRSGYSHHFVSPKNGSTLTWTPEIPGEETDHFFGPFDARVELTPQLTASWILGFRMRHAGMMQRAAMMYRLTNASHYATWATTQLDYYAANYAHWPPTNFGARLTWQPLDEVMVCSGYAETVRHLTADTDAATANTQRATWKASLFDPLLAGVNKNRASIHNIALWWRSVEANVALVFGDEVAWRAALDGQYGVRDQFAKGVTADYLWYEQSLGYNTFVINAAQGLFTLAGIYGRAEELSREMTICENMMFAPLALRFPNGDLPHPADVTGWQITPCPDRALFRSTYRIFPTTIGLEEANKPGVRGWDTLLDPPPRSPRPTVLPPVTSRNFEATRMAVLRSDPWQIFFHYGQLTNSHAQPEALNFSAAYGTVDVTHDTGVAGYTSPLNGYYMEPLCHNVPCIDGRGQDRYQPGELLGFSTSPPQVSAAQPYGRGGRAQRTLTIRNGELIDVVWLDTQQATPRRLGLLLHLQGRINIPPIFQPDPAGPTSQPGIATYWRDVVTATYQDHIVFDVDYGSVVMRVTITIPGSFRVWHGMSPDIPDKAPQHRSSIYCEIEGVHALMTTVFSPRKHGSP